MSRSRKLAWSAIAIVMVISCRTEYSAQYQVPKTPVLIGVSLRQTNPPLAEYERMLFLAAGDHQGVKLYPDVGGYALVNLYKVSDEAYRVETDGNHVYDLDVLQGTITARLKFQQPSSRFVGHGTFVGAFDFVEDRWVFINADERPEREIGRLYFPD